MGFRFKKSYKIAPGVKVNLNKKSTSVTFGEKGFHHTVSSTGKKTTTVGLPGTGISYSKTSGGNRSKSYTSQAAQSTSILPEPPQQNNKKWYEKTGWIIFFLIFFFPIGLFLMWKSNWKKLPKIIVSAFFGLALIAYMISPKLESVTLSADTGQIYDINCEIPIKVSTNPENYSLSELSFDASGGEITEKDGLFVFSAPKEGEYTVSVETNNVSSNKLTFSIEDKAAIAEAQAQKEAEEKARAEQEATENTSEMVDSIISQAKSDSSNQLDLDTCQEALSYLRDNYPNYFTDNSTMEKVMYYGAFLQYSFEGKGINDTCAKLGMDAVQSVKYVYRGIEHIEDEATQENLRQVEEGLATASLGDASISSPESNDEAQNSIESQTTPAEEMVWIPSSGTKYHRDSSCSNMTNPRQVTLSEAQSMGYEACKKCY